jgi:hypothetical protein
MNKSIIFRIIMALVLLGALAAIGVFAYNAGVAQGMSVNLQAPASGSGTAPVPYPYYGYWHAFPFFGFGCFGLLIPLFLVFLAFAAFRGLFWHGPRHWHRMHHGPWGMPRAGESGMDIPPMVAEWHRRMHEQQPEQKAE